MMTCLSSKPVRKQFRGAVGVRVAGVCDQGEASPRRCAPSSPPVGAVAKISPRGATGGRYRLGGRAPSLRFGTGRAGVLSSVYQGPPQLDEVGLPWRDLAADQDGPHDPDHHADETDLVQMAVSISADPAAHHRRLRARYSAPLRPDPAGGGQATRSMLRADSALKATAAPGT
jgi:hypothetical protein